MMARCGRWAGSLLLSLLSAPLLAGCTDDPDTAGSAAEPAPSTAATTEPTTEATTQPTTKATTKATTQPTTKATTGATKATGPPPRSVSLLASGDVLLHSGTWETAQADASRRGGTGLDFKPMFADVAPVVRSADLAICHLETPLAPPGGPFASYPVFSVPPQVAPALRETGYDACTTASNHSIDQGYDGLVRTLRTLDRARIPHDGTARSAGERRRPLVVDVDGVRIALMSYTYGTNGIPLPTGQPWSVPLIDPEQIVADAAAARRNGAEVVVVALHFGSEYVTAPDEYQTDVVNRITRSPDIDLVYGHHAHTVQPIDRVHGTWVAYGLGNFIAQQETFRPYTYRGATVRFQLTEPAAQGRAGRFEVSDVAYLPTLITRYDAADPRMRVLDVAAALDDPATPTVLVPELEATLADVRAAVLALDAGRIDPDVRVHLLQR